MMRAILVRGAGFALLWWVLAEGRPETWGLALVAAAGVALSFRLMPPRATAALTLGFGSSPKTGGARSPGRN